MSGTVKTDRANEVGIVRAPSDELMQEVFFRGWPDGPSRYSHATYLTSKSEYSPFMLFDSLLSFREFCRGEMTQDVNTKLGELIGISRKVQAFFEEFFKEQFLDAKKVHKGFEEQSMFSFTQLLMETYFTSDLRGEIIEKSKGTEVEGFFTYHD